MPSGLAVANQDNALSSINEVKQLRLWHSPARTRVVFDVNASVRYQKFTLENPHRLVVDISNAKLLSALPAIDPAHPLISGLRSAPRQNNDLRIVFDLKESPNVSDFLLSPNELYGHRLVIDLNHESATASPQIAPTPVAVQTNQQVAKPFLVAVDAGHGGEDPGAIGHRGSHEKKLTLQIAKKLVNTINQDPKMSAFLVRTGDYYIKLHKRREIARARNADMFISIHADAFSKSSARGFSVFALSQRGATSAMARALADKENASDLIGGVNLSDKSDVVKKVLVDLSMTNTISESVSFGALVLNQLSGLGKLHSKRVEQAGFAVLKSPDIPSVLIETGFITNPQEEKRLRSGAFQSKLASSIYTAIKQYVDKNPVNDAMRYAARTQGVNESAFTSLVKPKRPSYHKVRSGDSLSKIAERYGTSVKRLKQLNNLKSNTVVLGTRLKLPSGSTAVSSTSSTASSSSNSTARTTQRPAVHTVKRGESLSIISARYNVTIRSLKKLNNLTANTVYVGQRLRLPGGSVATQARAPRYHVVKRGDTLSEIAEQYNSTMRSIMQANKMRSRTVVLGQKLKIP